MTIKTTLLAQYGVTGALAMENLAGVNEKQSRLTPPSGGNCLNWVLGHLTDTYNSFLPLVGQEPIWQAEEGKPYSRHSAPLAEGAGQTWADLLTAWKTADERFRAGVAAFPEDRWDEKAPFSPVNNPDETMGSLLAILVFHQAYHVGQLGVLRRVAGLEAAVK